MSEVDCYHLSFQHTTMVCVCGGGDIDGMEEGNREWSQGHVHGIGDKKRREGNMGV